MSRQLNDITKQCTKCLEWLPKTKEYFYGQMSKSKKNPNSYLFSSWCKSCFQKKQYDYNIKNTEKISEYKKVWYKKNDEKVLAQMKVKYDPEYSYKSLSAWQKANPDKVKSYNDNRIKNKKHEININEWDACRLYFNYRCAYCEMSWEDHKRKNRQDLHKEHAIFDGANDLSNCIPSCRNCNSEKHEDHYTDWYNKKNHKFDRDKLKRINKWLKRDYKKFIDLNKKPYKPRS